MLEGLQPIRKEEIVRLRNDGGGVTIVETSLVTTTTTTMATSKKSNASEKKKSNKNDDNPNKPPKKKKTRTTFTTYQLEELGTHGLYLNSELGVQLFIFTHRLSCLPTQNLCCIYNSNS